MAIWWSAGLPRRKVMIEAYEARGVNVAQAWGMTEMSPIGTHGMLPAALEGAPAPERIAAKCCAGRRLFGVEFKIVDDEGRRMPHDGQASGELYVRGNTVISGYFENPQATAAAMDAEGWFGTGDVASVSPEGRLVIRDRAKDLVKSGGEWISSIDLENAALSHPAISACAVIAVPHPKWDERPVLVAVAAGQARPDLAEVQAHMAAHFAAWQLPDDLLWIEALPLTATGKVSKLTLRAQFADYVHPDLREAGHERRSWISRACPTGWRDICRALTGRSAAEKFSGGQSNPTYLLKTPARDYVLRRKPPGVLLKSAHAVEREFRVQRALAGTDVPVARMHVLCEDENVIGSPFYIMDAVPGRTFDAPSLPGLDPATRHAVIDEMNRVLAAIHEVDLEATGLTDYGPSGNYYRRQIDRWTAQYHATATEDLPEMEALIVWLDAHVPPKTGNAVWCMATTGSTICSSRPTAQTVSPCWIGSCRPSATPMPISPLSSCNGRCPPRPRGGGWRVWIAPPLACGRTRISSHAIARGGGWRRSRGSTSTSPSPIFAWRRSCRG